jgi:Fe-S oxidoreductase
VLLFPDTFTNYYEPEVGIAAVELLQRLQCDVVPAPPGPAGSHWPVDLRCCGRPLISNGMLDEAVANARHNVERLHLWAQQGQPILACEPSCILTIKDDYPALLSGDLRQKALDVAAQCFTFEEFTEKRLTELPGAFAFKGSPRRILFQAHCHQRALVGTAAAVRLLRRTGTEVIDLDAGCCGMAGSFGYEKEHYEISRLVGEQRLFPALRAEPDAVVVAPGFSCRLQIEHFTGRKALHPAAVLRSLLSEAANEAP